MKSLYLLEVNLKDRGIEENYFSYCQNGESRTREIFGNFYEYSNHLGNVLEVVTDRKLAINDGSGEVDYYVADVVSQSDYYPFGMIMPDRNESEADYRYGFNSMEKDDEVKGSKGTSYTTYFRQLDPRVGRWLSIDPKASSMPWQSPYSSMNNNPILLNDFLGDSSVSANKEMVQHTVDDLNAIYKRTYNIEQDAFSLVEVGGGSVGKIKGYAIVTNDIEGDPGFWDDSEGEDSRTDRRGYRLAIWQVLNMDFNIAIKPSEINGGWGHSEHHGVVELDDDLGFADENLPSHKSELTMGGVFLHEMIRHKSTFGETTIGAKQSANTLNRFYKQITSDTRESAHGRANAVPPELREWLKNAPSAVKVKLKWTKPPLGQRVSGG